MYDTLGRYSPWQGRLMTYTPREKKGIPYRATGKDYVMLHLLGLRAEKKRVFNLRTKLLPISFEPERCRGGWGVNVVVAQLGKRAQ